MPTREEVHYFGAGPARLPTYTLEKASQSLLNHDSTGLSLVEHSHRSVLSSNILATAASHFKKLLAVPDDGSWTVMFMQGGGTTQFSAIVYNLLGYWAERRLREYNGDISKVSKDLKDAKLDYILTGGWSQKASEEAKRLVGEDMVNIAADGRIHPDGQRGKWDTIPDQRTWNLSPVDYSVFTYYCDNETVDGVEFPYFPEILKGEGRVVVADMSSNILSRKIAIQNYHLIFAGAQKNLGITGITLVLLRTDILKIQPSLSNLRALNLPVPPIMMSYPAIAAAGSLYNTLPIFDVYIAAEVMSQLLLNDGVPAKEAEAKRKSEAVYEVVDKHPKTYQCVIAEKKYRSRMNVCFRITDAMKEKQFFKEAEGRGLIGLKGHRSVGGVRVSCYNAVEETSIQKLIEFMEQFANEAKLT